ncbi:MAG TPA: hypothetical protein P5181_08255 [Dermatophilaceae bacterium]|nr:hypothetical protein [Dermatophilaceae bacterium]
MAAGDTQACTKAVAACQGPAGAMGIGLLYEIYGRPVGSVDWAFVATTCFANQVPGGPVLNIGMIVQAFHTTPWATATVATQPEGNVTLVGLKTFYRVTWSEQGYQPGEIDPIDPGRMLGMRVDIRPKLVGLTYVFGDGATLGPTTSVGGTYPTGDITHTYVKAGTYLSRVDVTFGGEFRINGGPWTTIPDTVMITGPITTVQAKVAKAVLVQ